MNEVYFSTSTAKNEVKLNITPVIYYNRTKGKSSLPRDILYVEVCLLDVFSRGPSVGHFDTFVLHWKVVQL